MGKTVKKKPVKKTRSEKYDTKLKIYGTLDEVLKASIPENSSAVKERKLKK
ncbi:MAG: hypothetical protein H7Y00_09900 [Fimbriimonadaceae bacterium]|nr:hypothetical protein [Chitinophagales bacterium]